MFLFFGDKGYGILDPEQVSNQDNTQSLDKHFKENKILY